MMESEVNKVNTVIWGGPDDLHQFPTEECLPVIGSSQLSSILSTLEPPDKASNIDVTSNLELIVLNQANHIVNNGSVKGSRNKNLTYILCDLCPYLCLNEKDIKVHLELVHKNMKPTSVFELKCPACPNVFYHKLSLQSHLTYDHCINNLADVTQIIQVTLHSKKAVVYKNKLNLEIDISKTPIIIEDSVDVPIDNNDINEEEHTVDIPLGPDGNGGSETENEVVEHKQNVTEKIEPKPEAKPMKQNVVHKFMNIYGKLKCPVVNCKVHLQNPDKLKYHDQCHFNTIFKCPECGDLFPAWKTLSGHLWRAHKVDMELHRCEKCEYRTFSLTKLNNSHRLIHGTSKDFLCDVCNKSFKNVKQLRNHKDSHKRSTANTKVKCEQCDKYFTNRHQLRIHMDGIHKKLKPFLCSFCGYKGSTRSALKTHVRQHTGEKPFACDLCDYSSADHNSLRRHKLRHSGDKPYKCAHCDYQCIQSSTYKVHIKTKHPGLDKELLFSCPMCHFRSINKDVYKSHINSQHPEIK